MYVFRNLGLLFLLTACSTSFAQQSTATPSAVAAVAATPTVAPAPSAPPPSTAATTTTAPTTVPTVAATEASTATPDPYAEYAQFTIDGLRARSW